MFLLAPLLCGASSALFLARGREGDDRRAWAAAELTVLFGALTLITGPLWARALGHVVGVGRAAHVEPGGLDDRLGLSDSCGRYAARGSDKLAAGVALFGAVNVRSSSSR
jgi:heme exporter protein C